MDQVPSPDSSNQSNPGNKSGNLIKILLVLAGLIIIVLAYFIWHQQQQLAEYRNHFESLVNEVKPAQNTNTTTSPTPTAGDPRMLWTANSNVSGCEVKFNVDKPDTTVKYSNSEFGIEMMIPFNARWGTDKYRVNPFEERGGSEAIFGPVSGFEGCGWVRQFSMSTGPQRTAAQIVKEFNDAKDEYTSSIAEQFTINGITAVRYEQTGLCDQARLVLIGKKYNYHFYSMCAGLKDPGYADLIKVAETVKFIE